VRGRDLKTPEEISSARLTDAAEVIPLVSMKPIRVTVSDRMQQSYTYLLIEPMGGSFEKGFAPELTPGELLALGVFGGKYMTDCAAESPASWFRRAKLSPGRRDPKLNCFGVNASQPSQGRRSTSRSSGFTVSVP